MPNYPLFSVLGIEIEYMLVDKTSLCVQPKSDVILKELAGQLQNEVEIGNIAVSNELVMHVLELKTNGPKPAKEPIASYFHDAILTLLPILDRHNLLFLPTGAHPWMKPDTETHRWPYGNKEIYDTYNKVFNCQGHGFANLQSMHVNLPFANDTEFHYLHSLIRILLPLLPAISASTPIIENKKTGLLNTRLDFYAKNQMRIPSISGDIIPDFIHSQSEYQTKILNKMYQDISPLDPEKILQEEWLNSRAAIAKFDIMAIEIRIIDTQECVNADIAIAKAVHTILQNWHQNSDIHLTKPFATKPLRKIYDQTLTQGLSTIVEDKKLLEQWQLPSRSMSVRDIWSNLVERVASDLDFTSQQALEHILKHGNLSERIIKQCNGDFSTNNLQKIYRKLSTCLTSNCQLSP